MRRIVALVLAAGLVAGLGAPADAKKKKKKPPKPKTVETQLFLHGSLPLGELEANTGPFLPMDPTAPSGTEMKSYGITNYAAGPNTACAGNSLFPVWVGDVAGTIVGDLTFSFSTLGQAAQAEVRVWADVTDTLCNEQMPVPDATGIADIPEGEGTVEAVLGPATLSGNSFDAGLTLMIQVSPLAVGVPFVSRVLYDTADVPSSLTFQCIPPKGETACA